MSFKLKDDKLGVSKILRIMSMIQIVGASIAFPVMLLTSIFAYSGDIDMKIETISKSIDAGIILIISLFIFRILTNTIKNNPFDSKNINDMKILGLTLLGYSFGLILFSITSLGRNTDVIIQILDTIKINSTSAVIFSVVIFSIREIINVGVNIKKENELTV